MRFAAILLIIAAVLVVLVLAASYVCFYITFYISDKNKKPKGEFDLPTGSVYEPYSDAMIGWMKEIRALPHEDVEIVTFDGLKLRGKYYEYAPGAPIELMFHGYRGTAERDLCGGVQRCFKLGRNALLVDQRAASRSEGNVITFGVREHKDCLNWVDLKNRRYGPDVRIILSGISMGATTVLMAAGEELPSNVIGVLADCGFSSAKDIICKVIRQLKLPVRLVYPMIRLGAWLYGGFRLEDSDAAAAMKKCSRPVIFFHGTTDDFVPCEMSRINYAACEAEKKLVCVPNAGHGLSYLIDPPGYLRALREFGIQHWGLGEETNV